MDTITVWVMPHDDPEVVWVVNERDDMWGNYRDMGGTGLGGFDAYLDSWTRLEMPRSVFMSADPVIHAWVEAHVNGTGEVQ